MSNNKNILFPFFLFFGYLGWPFLKIHWVKNNILPNIKLVTKLFNNSIIHIFLSFFYPLIFIAILPNVMSAQYIVFAIASFIPIVVGVQVMPSVIISLKTSSMFKRIGASRIKAKDLSISMILFFSVTSIVSILFNLGIGIGIYYNKITFSAIDWGQLVLTLIFASIIGVSAGMFISSLIKSNEAALVFGLVLTLPGAFLSGEFLSPSLISTWGPVKYIAFIFPQKIATTFTHVCTNGGSIFQICDVYNHNLNLIGSIQDINKQIPNAIDDTTIQNILKLKELIISKWEVLISWILIPIEVITFVVISSKFMRWSDR